MLNYLHSQWYRTVRRKYLYIALAAALALGALYLYLVRAAIGDRPIGLESGVEEIVTGHCTGERGFQILKEVLGERAKQLRTGLVLNF